MPALRPAFPAVPFRLSATIPLLPLRLLSVAILLGFSLSVSLAPAQDPAPASFYLHGTGATANPPTIFLDNSSPTASTEKYKDSAGVNFSGGNPWKQIGTWTAGPGFTNGNLTALGVLQIWVGLKNSDDQGTQFDLRAEVDRNGLPVAAGETLCVTGVTRNPSNARQVLFPFGSFAGAAFNGTSDVLSLRVLTRIGTNPDGSKCSGPGGSHNNATGLRLYFDALARPASFDTTFSVGTDTTPPTITATTNPAPNSSGWNNSDVTVSFSCADTSSGVAFCSSPVTLSVEGANQTVQGTAQDNAGNAASLSVVVRIDKTAPGVVITSPSSGEALSVPDIVVTGEANDSLSGIATVTCNGSAASLSGSSFSCPMTLTAETNPLLVQAIDVAGNLASSQITVTLTGAALPPPQGIVLTPSTMSILVDEERDLEVVDEQGRPRSGASWTALPSGIVQISTSTGRPVLKGLSAGQATVTANLQGFMADTTVNVFAGTSLPPGTVRWSVTPTANFTTAQMIQAAPVENAPDLYSIELGPAGETLVRALFVDGKQRWAQFHGGAGETLVKAGPDARGGLLLQFQGSSFLIRLDPASGQQTWRYDSPAFLSSDWAVHPDGTIYLLETLIRQTSNDPAGSSLIGLDGNMGTVKSRIVLPLSSYWSVNTDCIAGANFGDNFESPTGPPMVAEDGSAYMEVSVHQSVTTWACSLSGVPSVGVSYRNTLSLLQVRPEGSATFLPLKVYDAPDPNGGFPFAGPAEVIPDGSGGLLAAWTFGPFTGSQETRISRWTPSGATEYTLPLNGWMNPDISLVLGENGTAFATDLSQVLSFDLATGVVQWTWQPPQGPVEMIMSTAGNGLVAKNRDEITGLETVLRLDSLGTSTYESWSNPSLKYAAGGLWYGQGSTSVLEGPEPNWPNSVWPEPGDENGRSSKGKIRVRVGKLTDIAITDPTVRDWVNTGLAYWQNKAGILFSWDGAIIPVPSCAPDRPSCTSSPDDPLNIREVSNVDNATEVLRRFRRPKGIDFVFVHSVQGGEKQAGVPGEIDPQTGQRRFTNVLISGHLPIEFVAAHELGHIFQLPHVVPGFNVLNPFDPAMFNLMCGENAFRCPEIPSDKITPGQLRIAQAGALRLPEE